MVFQVIHVSLCYLDEPQQSVITTGTQVWLGKHQNGIRLYIKLLYNYEKQLIEPTDNK